MEKEEEKDTQMTSEQSKTRTVDMQVDTLKNRRQADDALGYYYRGNSNYIPNTITVNYIPDDDEWNTMNDLDFNSTTLIHEQKHRDNYLNGASALPVGPEQAYKREMHDEISANIAELIALREEYLKTGDISVFDNHSKFTFYKEAIEKGEIDPKSTYQEDFDKEMSLIVNGTQEMWEEHFASSYVNQCLYYYKNKSDKGGVYAKHWDKNYQESLKIVYNIGGVDFTKYMKKDVEIPYKAREKIANDMGKGDTTYPVISACETAGFMKYDGSVTLEEYKRLIQRQIAKNQFENGEIIKEIKDGIAIYYTKDEIEAFSEEERVAAYFNHIKYSAYYTGYVADKIVNYQALEYSKSGKGFPTESGSDGYDRAMEKIDGWLWLESEDDASDIPVELPRDADAMVRHPELGYVAYNLIKIKQKRTKNQVVDPVNDQDPQYRQWENKDGSRVSDVQHVEILDLTKPLIKQPTRSRKAEEKNKEAIKSVMRQDADRASQKTQGYIWGNSQINTADSSQAYPKNTPLKNSTGRDDGR